MNHNSSKLFNFIWLSIIVLIQFSCKDEHEQNESKIIEAIVDDATSTLPEKIIPIEICHWDNYLIGLGLVDIQTVDSSIQVLLKYSTEDNFMHKDVYGCLSKCYLQLDVAERLSKCQTVLKELDSNLSLLVYDGLRPRIVQQYMWDILEMPIYEKTKFVSNPKNGSLHNYGAAVDITIIDLISGETLDMGTPYDYIGLEAWPSREPAMLKDSVLSQDQVNNRILLRKVMKSAYFFNIQTEWWHFNACNRNKAKELYQIVEGDSSLIKI